MVTDTHFLVQRMLGNLCLVQNLQHIHLQFPNNKDDYIRYICFGNYETNTLLLSISYFTVIIFFFSVTSLETLYNLYYFLTGNREIKFILYIFFVFALTTEIVTRFEFKFKHTIQVFIR